MIELSPSTYYYKPKRDRKERAKRDAELRDHIERVQVEYSCKGYRTVHENLLREGICVNGKCLRRVMRQYGLSVRIRRRFIRTTDSTHGLPVYPNLISGLTVTDINQVWVADITYIRIQTGFVFLAVILDIFSRRVVGWALSKSLEHSLTLEALKVAIESRNPPSGTIHHSDQGVQYACKEYIELLQSHPFRISMARKGDPYQNAFAESFFKTLKNEEVYLWEYESFIDVVERIPFFIEQVYNKKRLHSGIQYLPPEEFEIMLSDDDQKQSLGQINLNISPR